MKSNRAFYVSLAVGVVAAGVIATGIMSLQDPAVEIHETLRFSVIWRLWLSAVMDIIPVAVASSLLILYSLIIRPYDMPRNSSLLTVFRVHITVIVVLGLVGVLWQAVLGPQIRMKVVQLEHQSTLAIRAWNDAKTAYSLENYRDAREKAGIYGAIVGETPELEEFFSDLDVKDAVFRSAGEPTETVTETRETDVEEQTVVDLIERAQTYFDQGRYFSAHYFASRAIAMSSVERLDARRLQQRAMEAIQDEGRSIEESEESAYFNDKFAAYTSFQRSSDSPEMLIEAYYRFQALSEERPDDPDVQRYLPELAEGLTDISFFLDTARSYETYPGVNDIIFENESYEYVTIDRLVQVREGDFAFGVEILRLDGEKGVLYHLRAPYGKFIGGDLVLRAVRRDGIGYHLDENMVGPEYYRGDRSPEMRAFFPMSNTVDEIVRFGPGAEWLKQENIGRLFMAIPVFKNLGLPVTGIYLQLVERVLRSFGLIILLLAVMAIGWRYRSRYLERPPVLVLLMVPFVPFAVWGATELARYLARLIMVTTFSFLGRDWGFVILLLVPMAVLVWTLASLARQKSG